MPFQKTQRKQPSLLSRFLTVSAKTWSDIARAAFEVKDLRLERVKLFLKENGKECCATVSAKNPSLLRKTSAAEIQDLSLKKASLLYSVLMTAATPVRNKRRNEDMWLPSVVVAASVVLKQCCRNMNTVHLMVTTLIKYTGFHVSVMKTFVCFEEKMFKIMLFLLK